MSQPSESFIRRLRKDEPISAEATLSPIKNPIRYLKGIGPQRAESLSRLGIKKIEDLLYFYPRRYEDRSNVRQVQDIKEGEAITLKVKIHTVYLRRTRRMPILELTVGDETGVVRANWFNQPFLAKCFKSGDEIRLSGRPMRYRSTMTFSNPEFEKIVDEQDEGTHTGRIVPIYPLTEGVQQKALRNALFLAVEGGHQYLPECLPAEICRRLKLMPRKDAVQNIHFPENLDKLRAARRRLIFEEFLIFEILLLSRYHKNRLQTRAYTIPINEFELNRFINSLPYDLTASQRSCIGTISQDLSQAYPMRRLLQGDVGSGKTVVAAMAIHLCGLAGFQSVLLVPTEVLASQHYENMKNFLGKHMQINLLTGSVPMNERKELLADIRQGKTGLLIGTHAIIQGDLRFKKLGLVIVDEQHKFGVEQRGALLDTENIPHFLIMSATPIPRTLGLTLYGDLDISTITEMPKGRKTIQTSWVLKDGEKALLSRIASALKKGDQAFFIFPIIDETEKMDLQAASQTYDELRKGIFAGIKIGLVHGRMKKEDRDTVMKDFRSGKLSGIVATSVVEVGIDNPNASLMVIYHADRFGLSQLHQFRGRIGRGSKSSYCYLLGDPSTPEGQMRLKAMTEINDGFRIAEEDLKIRGPGDFLGTRQSGACLFRLGDISKHGKILDLARQEAIRLLKDKGALELPELKERLRDMGEAFDAFKT